MSYKLDVVELIGKDGTTFTPHINDKGVLSWSNNGGLKNPQPIKIVGESIKYDESIVNFPSDLFKSDLYRPTFLIQKFGSIVNLIGVCETKKDIEIGEIIFNIPFYYRSDTEKDITIYNNNNPLNLLIKTTGDVILKTKVLENTKLNIDFRYSLINRRLF